MVLVIAVFIGLAAGLIRAWVNKTRYNAIELHYPGLVILAFVPQFIAFALPATRSSLPDSTVSALFGFSQVFLLAFSILNIRNNSFWPVILGVVLNILVISLNGGWMPISPGTVQKLIPNAPAGAWSIGNRLGTGKDFVLPVEATRLWFLSDHLMLPDWVPYKVAFSVGDVFMSLGVIWLLWSMGRTAEGSSKEFSHEQHLS
jgi:hypothetical protein